MTVPFTMEMRSPAATRSDTWEACSPHASTKRTSLRLSVAARCNSSLSVVPARQYRSRPRTAEGASAWRPRQSIFGAADAAALLSRVVVEHSRNKHCSASAAALSD